MKLGTGAARVADLNPPRTAAEMAGQLSVFPKGVHPAICWSVPVAGAAVPGSSVAGAATGNEAGDPAGL